MKRIKLFTAALLLCCTMLTVQTAHAGLVLGGFGGYSLGLSDITGLDNAVNGGIIYGGNLGFKLPAIPLTIGALAWYQPITSVSMESVYYKLDLSATAVPAIFYGKLNIGPAFIMAGAGLAFWKSKASIGAISAEETGSNVAYAIGGGVEPKLTKIGIPVTVLYNGFTSDGDAVSSLNFTVGINLYL